MISVLSVLQTLQKPPNKTESTDQRASALIPLPFLFRPSFLGYQNATCLKVANVVFDVSIKVRTVSRSVDGFWGSFRSGNELILH